jgi:hypothetical protein
MSYLFKRLMDMAISTYYDDQNNIYDVNIYDEETKVNINITNKYMTDPTKKNFQGKRPQIHGGGRERKRLKQ